MGARSTATLSDVARRAGVSPATASRVINGSARTVSARYRDRVPCGLRAPEVIEGAFTRDGGHAATAGLRTLPECVFAVNDVMAIGAMAALRERGVRMPDDVAVAGFDDIPTLRDVAPSLTTVRLPLTEMGRLAATMVLERSRPSDPAW
jgi:DNA-binding LacI/PurR family transcriptional regulator